MKRLLGLLCLLALALTACAQTPFGEYTLDGGAVCRVWGSTSGLRRLEVTGTDGTVRSFSLPSPDIEPDPTGGIELIDLDFDGHADVRIKARQYADGDLRYTCFLWRDGTLEQSDALSAMRALSTNAKTATLTAWETYTVAEERESRARLIYIWQDGEPAAIEKTELIYYIEEDIYFRAVYTAEPGEPLTLTEEKWIFPEEFDETEIWN